MVGILGIGESGTVPSELVEPLQFEDWYGVTRHVEGDHGIGLVHHADRDPAGWSVAETDRGTLFVYGYFVDRGGFESDAALLDGILDDPASTLAELDGSFALAATDGVRLLAATDKLASRTLYAVPSEGAFASHLGALVSVVDDPTVDVRAISEILQDGFTWGRKTLVEGIDSLTYGEYVLVENGDTTIGSYWTFDSTVDRDAYVTSVYDAFAEAVAESVDSVPDDRRLGVYLSGGLDSRLLADMVTDSRSDIVSLTYDANPGGGLNLDSAHDLAKSLEIDNETLTYTPETTAEHLREGVRRTDGMQSWHELHALPGQLEELSDHADVVFWAGGQGELFGEDIPSHVCEGDVVASFTDHWSSDIADHVLVDAPPIRETFEEEFARVDRPTPYERASELMIRNYYPHAHARSNVSQTVVGFRAAHALGSVVDAATPVPREFRWGHIPAFLNRFGHVLAPLKLELVRRRGGPITRIPYERTGVAPRRSIWFHDASKIPDLLWNALDRTAGVTMFDEWYRDGETLRAEVDDLLDGAMDRPFFDADALSSLRERHHAREGNHIDPIAKVTTVEAWLQAYLD